MNTWIYGLREYGAIWLKRTRGYFALVSIVLTSPLTMLNKDLLFYVEKNSTRKTKNSHTKHLSLLNRYIQQLLLYFNVHTVNEYCYISSLICLRGRKFSVHWPVCKLITFFSEMFRDDYAAGGDDRAPGGVLVGSFP